MPYLNLKTTARKKEETTQSIVDILLSNTTDILGKKEDVTAINIEYLNADTWFIGKNSLKDSSKTTFYLDIKITEGTNTKAQKALYIKNVFSKLEELFENISKESYIVIDDVKGDSWGFDGKTQEYRYIQSLS